MRQGHIIAVVLTLFIVCLSVPAWSDQRIVVGVEKLSYAPYFRTENGEYLGYARELIDMFGDEYGYDVVYDPLPVQRLFHDFMEGERLDFKFPDSPYWRQSLRHGKVIHYSEPLCGYTDGLLVLPERKSLGLDAINVLGVIYGFDYWKTIPELVSESVRISVNNSMFGLISKALVGRVDAIYANVAVVKHRLALMDEEGQLVFDSDLPYHGGTFRMSTITRLDVLQQFNTFLSERVDLVRALQKKYGVNQPEELEKGH